VFGGLATAAGIGFLASAVTASCETEMSFEEGLGCGVGAMFETLAGVVLLTTGASGLIYNEVRSTVREPEAAPPVAVIEHHYVAGAGDIGEPATADPVLRNLTLQASVAARAGHCAVVRSIATRVADRDRSYRRDGFVTDQAIVRCLER
jgi:hypothetical protein